MNRLTPLFGDGLVLLLTRFVSPARVYAGRLEQVEGALMMPTIAYFYGIAIRMYFRDHPPPHFFAAYSGHEANVSIETGDVIEGHLPANAARLVKQWALAHRGELEDNWGRARTSQPLVKISGLDDD